MCSISSFLSEEEECSHVSTALRVSSLLFSPFFALPLIWVDDKLVVQLSKKKNLLIINTLLQRISSSSVLSRRHKKKKKKEKNGIIVLEKRFGVEIVGE